MHKECRVHVSELALAKQCFKVDAVRYMQHVRQKVTAKDHEISAEESQEHDVPVDESLKFKTMKYRNSLVHLILMDH